MRPRPCYEATASNAAVTTRAPEVGGNHPRKGVDTPRRLEQNLEAVSNRGRDRRRRVRVTADQLEVRHSPQRGLADPVVVAAQQQVNRVRTAGGSRHHCCDHRLGRAAAGTFVTGDRRASYASSPASSARMARVTMLRCTNRPRRPDSGCDPHDACPRCWPGGPAPERLRTPGFPATRTALPPDPGIGDFRTWHRWHLYAWPGSEIHTK